MIEKIMILIIQELGPTGLLICGLYLILGKHLKKISKHIEIINGELGEGKAIMHEIKEILKNKKNG